MFDIEITDMNPSFSTTLTTPCTMLGYTFSASAVLQRLAPSREILSMYDADTGCAFVEYVYCDIS